MNSEDGEPDLVELTRGTLQAANRRDWDALMSLHAPGSVWDASRFDLGIYEGPAEIRGLFESWVSFLFQWLDGKISRVTAYPGIEEARAAAERLALGS